MWFVKYLTDSLKTQFFSSLIYFGITNILRWLKLIK